jgi:uncharacterized RDD family membrane protein YckC
MTKTPLKIDGISDSLYAGFWSRLGSLLLDFLIILPVTGIILYVNNLALGYYILTIVPSLIFGLWYNIYLVQKYGGTPGKLIVGIKIISSNGKKVEWKHAILRHLVLFAITLISIFMMIRAVGIADESYYASLTWMQKSQYLMSLSPILLLIYTWSSNIWIYGELIVLLTNKRKRAVHDFIAGTVIIKKEYEEAIRNNLID